MSQGAIKDDMETIVETGQTGIHYSTVKNGIATTITLNVTDALRQRARRLAHLRMQSNRNRRPSSDLGPRNFQIDFFGGLAELCIYSALETCGYRPVYELLAYRAVPGPDMRLN